MKELYQQRDGILQIIKHILPNGKQVLLLINAKQIISYERWPDSPWEPIDPRILKFTLPRETPYRKVLG